LVAICFGPGIGSPLKIIRQRLPSIAFLYFICIIYGMNNYKG
jgi:hypothetical protein